MGEFKPLTEDLRDAIRERDTARNGLAELVRREMITESRAAELAGCTLKEMRNYVVGETDETSTP